MQVHASGSIPRSNVNILVLLGTTNLILGTIYLMLETAYSVLTYFGTRFDLF